MELRNEELAEQIKATIAEWEVSKSRLENLGVELSHPAFFDVPQDVAAAIGCNLHAFRNDAKTAIATYRIGYISLHLSDVDAERIVSEKEATNA